MLFAEYERCHFLRPPLMEVICQLRFPTILSIGTEEPVAFQEAVRADFPRYLARQEPQPPKMVPGNPPHMENQKPMTNYYFISNGGRWKINLTQEFVALSTLSYRSWEEFAAQLDKLLARFIQLYHTTTFDRLGLRYVNALSRKSLGVEDLLWDDLIRDPYLGILGEPDVDEKSVHKCALQVQSDLADGNRMKISAGPGLINGGKNDPEVKFILDYDLSRLGQMKAAELPTRLEELHRHAVCLFRGAFTPEAFEAMGPVE